MIHYGFETLAHRCKQTDNVDIYDYDSYSITFNEKNNNMYLICLISSLGIIKTPVLKYNIAVPIWSLINIDSIDKRNSLIEYFKNKRPLGNRWYPLLPFKTPTPVSLKKP